MKLSRTDIGYLYGNTFYLIPEGISSNKQQEDPSLKTFFQGSNITWKIKSQSKIALILEETEFSNRNLTNSLKSLILQANISPTQIGFGIIQQIDHNFDLTDMPMKIGVFFGGFTDSAQAELPSSLSLADKDLFFTKKMSQITASDSLQAEVITMLKRVKFLLNP